MENNFFTELLDLLKQMLPEDNNLSDRYYDAKKILFPMDLEYTKIYAFYNDCIFYMQEYKNLDQCSEYGESRYKVNGNSGDDYDDVSKKCPPAKVLWYLAIILWFKILFTNADDAKNIRWHADEREYDGSIHHVPDSL